MRRKSQHDHDRQSETVDRFYNFTVAPRGGGEPVHLYGFFRMKATDTFKTSPLFDFLVGENPVVKFLPANYHIQVIAIAGSEQPFTLIEGKRCKWRCNRKTRECENSVCWEEPSFCRGPHEDCLRLDGDGTCYDLQEDGLPKDVDYIWNSNSTHKIFTNINIARYIKYHEGNHYFITEQGQVQDHLTLGYHWACEEIVPGGEHIFCQDDWSHVGVSTYLLKTIAG